ncbi:Carnitine O-acetyltransferase mitochondrial [Vanrija albida]|uniref:Carnitine O-acetyltransferase mitochondrial n=1 Tax=Vanrija albida TaxID=181172 RepID=A0ABR3PXR5_9TREE
MLARKANRTTTRLASSAFRPNMTVQLAPARAVSSSAKRANAASDKPLYASQSTIPHLPVPRLAATLHKYLESLLPLQTRDEHAKSAQVVRQFADSDLAHILQARLEGRAAEKDSWLSEWWNDAAYMGYRGRLIPNVNYFYIHKKGLGKGASQTERAAQLIRAVVEFKKLTDSEKLEPEKVKGQPLCMNSYHYLFNAVRVPTSPADVPLAYPRDLNHIVVLRNDRYYKLEVGGRSASEITAALNEIKKAADAAGPGAPIGVLTADDRDVWTEFRRHLLSISKNNTKSIIDIDSSILLVDLDSGAAPKNDTERAWSYWAGGLTPEPQTKGHNRWFDKHQFIVDEAGESGFNGEHSMLDGTPTLRLNEFVLASLDKGVIPLELPEAERAKGPIEWSEIKFDLDAKLKEDITKSQKGFGAEITKQDLEMVVFDEYGKNLIKTFKVSPDAYVQMVKQLAFFKLHGRPAVTYESCQTRKFLLGRTEVIRSASNESRAFCEAMLDPKATDAERDAKLRAAAARHSQYSAWAADGQGVDRHLFGLKKLVREDEEMPAIFLDPAFSKSSHWEFSTSNLGSKFLDGWGYGEVVPDGYGLSYAVHDDKLCWGITTLNGDAHTLAEALKEAARDVRGMLERAKGAKL